MTKQYFSLKVKDIRPETEECVSVAFDLPEELRKKFEFVQGQYLSVKKDLNGEEVRRQYSICSGPSDEELRVAIKKVEGGLFSTYANEVLSVGDTLDLMPPQGHFFKTLDDKRTHHYVAFAAGSGITPVMSILKATLEKEPDSTFTLFYGNRKTDTIIFREELEALKNRYLGRLQIHHVLSREDVGSDWFTGRIDAEKCRFYFDKLIDVEDVDAFFLCGPFEMTQEVKKELEEAGVGADRIRTELFFVDPDKIVRKKPKKRGSNISTSEAVVQVTLDGQTQQFTMEMDSEAILNEAIKAGLDLPFSCKGGVCSTCRARLEKGEVEMLINYALEKDELERGYVLTCQSLAKSKEISINFDA
jgi:ring-1,2-phenylacetyl-CoA epoxidase subunit PaaE